MSNSEIIESVCLALNENNKEECKRIINEDYPFNYVDIQSRHYSHKKLMQLFIRDGFIDRYSGDKLVFPGALMVLSKELPVDFPYQQNWKMSECHIGWWHLFPTADHIMPIARGGHNDYDNLVCTSMLRNSAKSNYTLEELGWTLYDKGDFNEWDGMTSWFIQYVDRNTQLLEIKYIKDWYKAAKRVLELK